MGIQTLNIQQLEEEIMFCIKVQHLFRAVAVQAIPLSQHKKYSTMIRPTWYSIIDEYNGGFLEFFSTSYIARLDLKEVKLPDDSKVNSL